MQLKWQQTKKEEENRVKEKENSHSGSIEILSKKNAQISKTTCLEILCLTYQLCCCT